MTLGLHDLIALLPFARVTIAGSIASLARRRRQRKQCKKG
jgi:hypothetical protein